MKFLCVECDERMEFADRQQPGDGTLAAVFECPGCGRAVGMLTNPMETQLVSSLGVQIGGRTVERQPMEDTRRQVESGRRDAFDDAEDPPSPERADGEGGARSEADGPVPAGGGAEDAEEGAPGGAPDTGRPPEWTPDAARRLQRVPSFVRGMVHRIYTDWARERGIDEITPEVMDEARSDLGLEGM